MAKKKRVTKKRPSKSNKIMVSDKKIKRTTNSLIYSGIVFILSLILFLVAVNESFIESLFGFILIISGAFVILFLILEIIFYFMKKK